MTKIASLFILLAAFSIPQLVFADPINVGVGGGVGSTQSQPTPPPVPALLGGLETPAPTQSSSSGPTDLTTPTNPDRDLDSLQKGVSAAELATQFQCPTSNEESALEGALGRLGDAAIDGVQGSLRGQGTFGRMVSDILGGDNIEDIFRGAGEDLVSGVGDYADDLISDELRGACGDSGLGRRICGRVGNMLGNFVEGAINQYGGQLLNQGLSSLGFGEAGGMLGGIAGFAGGLFGGGNEVPTTNQKLQELTDERTSEANALAASIQNLNVIEVRRNCETNPLISTLVNQSRAKVASQALQVGTEQFVQNPTEAGKTAEREAKIAFIESRQNDAERSQAARWLLQEERGENVNACDSTNPLDKLFNEEACASKARTFNAYQKAGALGRAAYEKSLDPTSETAPQGVCIDGPNQGQTNKPELCPGKYARVTPASDIASTRQKALQLALDTEADAPGEAPGSLVTDIFELVTEIREDITDAATDEIESAARQGLRKLLSDDRDSSGRRGGGTYTDRLAGRVQQAGPTLTEGRRYMTSDIANSVALEAEFQELTAEAIITLESLSGIFGEMGACYQAHAQTPPAGLTRETALQAAANASTTIERVLKPQLERHRDNLARSQGTVNNLGVLLDQAKAATGAAALNQVSENYTALRTAGILYSPAEIKYIAEELANHVAALKVAEDDANSQLDACIAYAATDGG